MTIITQVLNTILPGQILAVQVGFSRTAVMAETEEGIRCGLSATLTNPKTRHTHQPYVNNPGHLHEMTSYELAALIESPSITEVAIGMAAVNALLPSNSDLLLDLKAHDYLAQNCVGKNVVVIGHFPFIDRIKPFAENLWVFELDPREGDLPAQTAPEYIPRADFVAITATTMINKSFEDLVAICKPEATVIMLGPSTPLTPVLFDHGVDMLSGTVVDNPHAVMLGISQGSSVYQLREKGFVRFVTMKK